jgi:hypothetical protein
VVYERVFIPVAPAFGTPPLPLLPAAARRLEVGEEVLVRLTRRSEVAPPGTGTRRLRRMGRRSPRGASRLSQKANAERAAENVRDNAGGATGP